MLVLAAPALSLRMALSDAGNDPAGTTTRKAYDLLAQGFGRVQRPARGRRAAAPVKTTAALDRIDAALRDTPGIVSVAPVVTSPNGRVAVEPGLPAHRPAGRGHQRPRHPACATRSSRRSRKAAARPCSSAGRRDGSIDFTSVLSNKLPLFIAIVVGLAALLLLVVFRSLVIPLQAAVMNLLSIGSGARADGCGLPVRLARRRRWRRQGRSTRGSR